MRVFLLMIVLAVLTACSDSVSPESLKEEITKKEDLLRKVPPGDNAAQETDAMRLELVDALLNYYRTYPEDDYAPECLDKVHFVYSGMRNYATAAKYGDTLLEQYPKYVNREMVIESQYNTYDMFLKPRDKEKAKYYLEMWLKEFPNMPAEKKEEIEYRLKYIDLTIEQIMEMQMTELK